MTATAGNSGISIEALARLDRFLLSRYIEPENIAGCLTLIARHGEIAHLSAMGMMDREQNKPMAVNAIFRLYSMSKPITSVAMMQLHERGLFQLTDPVSRFIPQWRDLEVLAGGDFPDYVTKPPERPMTMRDLLSHQSGLTYGFMGGPVETGYFERQVYRAGTMRGRDLQSMIDRLADLPLKFSPGDHWNYGLSTDVCGYLVQVISGQRFDEYLQEHVFDPLGMDRHGLPRAGREASPTRHQLRAWSRQPTASDRHVRGRRIPRAADLPVRRRRPCLDCSGLLAVLPDDARRRRA